MMSVARVVGSECVVYVSDQVYQIYRLRMLMYVTCLCGPPCMQRVVVDGYVCVCVRACVVMSAHATRLGRSGNKAKKGLAWRASKSCKKENGVFLTRCWTGDFSARVPKLQSGPCGELTPRWLRKRRTMLLLMRCVNARMREWMRRCGRRCNNARELQQAKQWAMDEWEMDGWQRCARVVGVAGKAGFANGEQKRERESCSRTKEEII
ncbi:hypothetical protein B0J18DRAFT_130194 [Chaetomium sp. MPI-SDFR-AT-0129]|nr:hypothetical protein B0J18DRAFT_130194 [Chaetomium sp. MPI-SDFR-AT-0129]